jgi:hypothetical protein
VFTDRKNVLTGQMYFPDALSQYLFANVSAYGRKVKRRRSWTWRMAASATSRKRPTTTWQP